jgi:hypothetical protein
MPDIDITAVEGYGEAVQKYNDAKRAAEGDPLALAQAESQWARDNASLTERGYAHRDAVRAREAALTMAAAKYPDVDPELYNDATDPGAIETRAAKLQEAINKARGPQAQPPESWGGTPPSGSVGAPSNAPPKSRDERIAELERTVRTGGIRTLAENTELKNLTMEELLESVGIKPAAAAQ